MQDPKLAREVQQLFASPYMRVNTTTDVTGVEICGALKNVLAIAAGIVEGLDLGHNAMAALVAQVRHLPTQHSAVSCGSMLSCLLHCWWDYHEAFLLTASHTVGRYHVAMWVQMKSRCKDSQNASMCRRITETSQSSFHFEMEVQRQVLFNMSATADFVLLHTLSATCDMFRAIF